MKPKSLKLIALLLSVIVLMQSCSIYTYIPTTVDEAVKSGFSNKIKVKTNTNETYLFIKLEKQDEKMYGLAKKKSATAKKLSNQITEISQFNSVKIHIKQEQFKRIYIKRKAKTLSIVVPVVAVVGLLSIAVKDTYADIFHNFR